MDQKLYDHYLQLWRLSDSLRKDWWDTTEKARIKQLLKDAASQDPTLSGVLRLPEEEFVEGLSLQLSSLVISKPDIPQSNMPSRTLLEQWKTQGEDHLKNLKKSRESIPVVFPGLDNIPQDETYLILKKHGLVDSDGNFDLSNTSNLINAQEEIGLRMAYYRHFQQIREALTVNLENNRSPVSLFFKQTFGDNTPGLVDAAARRIAENANGELANSLWNNLSGHPISLSSPGIHSALADSASSLKTTAITRGFISHPEAVQFARNFLANSSRFQLLGPNEQQLAIDRLTQAIVATGSDPNLSPTEFDDVFIRQEGSEASLKITPVNASASPGEEYQCRSVCTQPKTIGQRIQKELSLPDTYASTHQVISLMEDLYEDPIRAMLYYPYNGVLDLLPEPLRGKRYKAFKKIWTERYALTVSPDAQREYVEDKLKDLGKKVITATLKPIGLFTQNDQFAPLAAISWGIDKLTTAVGEGLGDLFSKIKFLGIGNVLGNIFRRRLGKGRKKDQSLITDLLGVLLDLSIAVIGIGPKLSWLLINKIPGVKEFRTSVAKKWINFRFGVETKFPVLTYARITGGVFKSLVRSLPRGLITTGIGLVATGNPAIAIAAGSADFLFIFLKNLGKISDIAKWAIGPHTTISGRFFGWAMSSRWAYLPIRGPFTAWLIVDKILPGWFGVNLPLWAKILTTVGSGGLEYGIATGIKPLLPSFISRFITGPLGKFFGFLGQLLNPGAFLGGGAAILAGLNPLQVILAGAGGGLAYLGLVKLLFGVISPFLLTGWLGYLGGGVLANALGLTGWYALGFQGLTTALSLWLTHIGIEALAGWITSSVAAGLNAALAGTSAAATGTIAAAATTVATVLLVVTLIVGNIYIVWNVSSAFFQQKAIHKGLINTRLNINKSLVNVQKNSSNEVISLDYRITYTYRPQSGDPPGSLTITKIIDQFELGWIFPEFNIIKRSSDYSPNSFTCNPSDVVWNYQGTVSYFIWEKLDSSCPQLATVLPGETKTLDIHLVFKDSWQKSKILSKLNICNIPTVWANLPDGKPLDPPSSLPPLCISPDGKIVKTPAAELALKIIRELQKCGITNMDTTNIDEAQKCLVAANIPQVAIDIMIQSMTVLNFKSVQCLSFIEAVEAATGGKLNTYGLGTASKYWTGLPDYQQIDVSDYNNIAIGDILVWTTGVAGHVAIVTRPIYDSAGQLVKVEIAENLGTTTQGQMNIREIPVTSGGIDSPGLAGWQRRK